MSNRPLANRTAFITGASSGLGLHFAHLLSDAGANVVLAARRTDRLEAAVTAIRANGGEALAVALDVTDVDAIGPAMDAAQAALGPISILVNNAGVSGDGAALSLPAAVFDQTFDVNVRGVFMAAREAAKRMLDSGVAAAGDARIVNIASIAGLTQLPGLTAYCASKAAVISLTQGLAREWAKRHIAVNAIAPGYIETEINADWFATDAGKAQIESFPRRRLMDGDALDQALLLLAGPAARFITGSIIAVDDGQSL
ncbi:SDR family NAD(P)-dependent oxidoreductase [Brevundimonas lenta]|uniref:D-xylose 1-dehydrogenase n=1 Tax=Brevundimonas lenta TaxID=424796 RepID=A0A7W6JCD7_9CAUL|nr:SDR family NAD(P)-dependent oxidoreductase [Brevundimonas lenta]MBB4082462.1 NAD(P)-dependent dehydrogenase (short-subunit alcohol dehydrogenase family) [Brevundimonas lenta]